MLGAKPVKPRDEGMISKEWTWDTYAEERGTWWEKRRDFLIRDQKTERCRHHFLVFLQTYRTVGCLALFHTNSQHVVSWSVLAYSAVSENEALRYVLNNAQCNGKRSVWLTQGQESNFSFTAYVQPLRILEGLFFPGAISSLSLHFLKKKKKKKDL